MEGPLSVSTESTEAATTEGRITDDDVERAKAQIGIAVHQRDVPWNRVPESDAISHFAFGCGDDNPLFHDPQYGASTRWHAQIAPPTFPIAAGLDQTPAFIGTERKDLFRSLFRGVRKYYKGVKWTFYQPVYAHRPVLCETYTLDVELTEDPARSVKETFRYLYVDVNGNPIATRDETYVSAERRSAPAAASSKPKSKPKLERQHWTPEQIEEIDAAYDAEVRRGAEPNWWEDVSVGDGLAPVMKGPLTVVDVISMHMGWGWGGYGVGPLRYGREFRKRAPTFYPTDDYGVPDVAQRVHWDTERADALGLPAPYDYGQMRVAWVTQLLTNWIGDDGWLAGLELQLRGFNYLGDTQTCTATVLAKGDAPRDPVTLEVRAASQRGEDSAEGKATVLLPSKVAGAVALPMPSEQLRGRGAQVASRMSGRVGEEIRRLHGE